MHSPILLQGVTKSKNSKCDAVKLPYTFLFLEMNFLQRFFVCFINKLSLVKKNPLSGNKKRSLWVIYLCSVFYCAHMRDRLKNKRQIFERTMLPHVEHCYNLAVWLTNKNDADDVVQEAYLKAFRLFDQYTDLNSKAWILTIVRNTSYSWLKKQQKYLMR